MSMLEIIAFSYFVAFVPAIIIAVGDFHSDLPRLLLLYALWPLLILWVAGYLADGILFGGWIEQTKIRRRIRLAERDRKAIELRRQAEEAEALLREERDRYLDSVIP